MKAEERQKLRDNPMFDNELVESARQAWIDGQFALTTGDGMLLAGANGEFLGILANIEHRLQPVDDLSLRTLADTIRRDFRGWDDRDPRRHERAREALDTLVTYAADLKARLQEANHAIDTLHGRTTQGASN